MSSSSDSATPPQGRPTRPAVGPTGREPMWTVAELLDWTRQKFEGAGIPSARADAEHLLAHALGWSRLSLYVRFSEVVDEAAKGRFREAVKRRLRREPVAYIEGRRGFHALDLELEVDPRVLIPRPETEHLVDWLLEELPHAPSPCAVLDVGTGSGAIALAIAFARPDAAVRAVDVSEAALELAQDNAARLGLRVSFACSDLLEALALPARGFDAIAANLPYIRSDEIPELEPEVRAFEPHLALDGGADGLRLIEQLIAQVEARDALVPGGRLYLEIGRGQDAAVAQRLRDGGWREVDVRSDYADIGRVVRGVR